MTSEEIPDTASKYKTVLNALIQQNYNVINDVYLDMFITHISGKNGEDYTKLLSDEFTFDWIERSVKKILEEHTRSVHGFAFTCQLLALLTEDQKNFQKFYERQIYNTIQNGLNDSNDLQNPSSKLALITLYRSMLKHNDGIDWLKSELAWKRAINYCFEDHTIYVVRRATEFVVDFLFTISTDDKLCLEIISEISRPLMENVFAEQIGNVCVDSCEIQRIVTPSIDILCSVLDRYIVLNQKSSIAHHIIKTTKGQINMWKLGDMTHERKLWAKLSQCMIYMSYALLVDQLNKNSIPDKTVDFDYNDFGLSFLNNCRICILRNQHEALLTSAKLYYVLWKKMGDRVPEEINLGNQLTKFENQIILFLILPLINVMHRNDTCYPELHDEYVNKLFQISTEHTLRICYSFRNSINNGNIDLYSIASKAIQGILSIINILHRDRAVIVFQALCHIIRSVRNRERDPKNILTLVERPTFMSSVLNALHTIVKKYRITWNESYESIGLLNCMLYSMDDPNISPRLAVEVLKLAQLSVEHFLAPNLALLVDTLSGSEMQRLGPMILKRLHDSNWEVRDSVLELLSSMANISLLKFPAFQEHILSNGLCPLVVEIAKSDSEYYVRASALCCISQMIPVNLFWEQCFSSHDLITYLIEVIQTEDEGVVRKEAVSLITRIYENSKVSSNQMESIYVIMSFAAIHDLFWEVKVKAIDFWHCVIQHHLQYQGVIDGTFPSVTFSKENKKIVTLTQKEITLRLTKVLDKLSGCGCLGVLLASLEDRDDLIVVKTGVNVIRCLAQFLEKYNYWEQPHQNTVQSSNTIELSSNTINGSEDMETDAISSQNDQELKSSDDVIQSIVSAQDINLLTKAYENQLNVYSTDTSNSILNDSKKYFKQFSAIAPNTFLNRIKTTNLNDLIKVRTEWLAQTESFSSLLNDMLYSLEAHESHDADCY